MSAELNFAVSAQLHVVYCPEQTKLDSINLKEGPKGVPSQLIANERELLEKIAQDLPGGSRSIKKNPRSYHMRVESGELSPFKKLVVKKMQGLI